MRREKKNILFINQMQSVAKLQSFYVNLRDKFCKWLPKCPTHVQYLDIACKLLPIDTAIATFASGVIFHHILSYAEFSKLVFSRNSFRRIIRVSNSLDPDQARLLVGPDLDQNCLQR